MSDDCTFNLVSFASEKLRICKSLSACCANLFSSTNLKLSELQEHFDNGDGRANLVGYDEKSLQEKGERFDSRATLPKLGFVSIDKPLLMA